MTGGGATVVVGGAGGGLGALVVFGGGAAVVGTDLGVVATGGAAPLVVGSVTGGGTVVMDEPGAFGGVALGAGRLARDAGLVVRALVAGAFFTAGAGATLAAGVWAGVALAIAAASPPVAITAPAATPLVTSDSRRSARSRWWAGGEAIES